MEEQVLGISLISEVDGKRETYFVGNFVETMLGVPLNTLIENIDVSENESDKLYDVVFTLLNDTELEFSLLKNQLAIWHTDDSDVYDKFKKESELSSEAYIDSLEEQEKEIEKINKEKARRSLKPNGI
ncbi:MAG: hypothetical protein WAX22_09910 [Lactococcus hircilactis]